VYTQTAVNLDLDVKSPAWPMLHGDPIFLKGIAGVLRTP